MYNAPMEVLVVPASMSAIGGPEVVHKNACLPDERERLLHEAEVLRMAAERAVGGVARVVAAPSPEADEPTLVTAAADGPSLAVAGPLPVLEVAGIAAEVARLLAGLHDAGLVHGAVEPGHVVLDGPRGAILVGLGHGGEAGAMPVAADPGSAPSPRLDPAIDVAGWGALVTHLLDWSASTEEEPLVALRRTLGSRSGPRRRARTPVPAAEEDRRALAALADQAQDPDPAHRPTARALAAAVAHRIPQARLPGRGTGGPGAGTGSTGIAVGTVGRVAVTGLLERLSGHLLVAPAAAGEGPSASRGEIGGPAQTRVRGLAGTPEEGTGHAGSIVAPAAARRRRSWFGPTSPHRRLAAGGLAVLALLGLALAVGPSRPEPGTAPAPGCPPVSGPSADVDADGCREAVTWTAGVLQAGAARFAFGAPVDAWAVGDWDCDGQRTPALLHAGSLIVFDVWPGPGGEEHGRPVASIPGAHRLSVVAGPDGCDQPALGRPGAADLQVDPRGGP